MNNLFLSAKYHNTTNNVVQSIPTYAANNVVKFKVNPLQAIKVAKSLGSYTKSQSTFTKVTKQPLPSKQDTRSLLFKQKDEVGRLMPTHRTRWCLCNKCKPDDAVGIKVKKTVKDKKATFTGLFRCDSVWTCPVCGQRILAQRGREIEKAIAMQLEKGHSVFMLTLTHSHQLGENLKEKLGLIGKALTRFFGDRAMQYVFEQFGMIGHIKALEVTHSFANGWHPHNHILMFSQFSPDQFKNDLVAVYFDEEGFIKVVTPYVEKRLIKQGKDHLVTHVTIEQFIKHYWRKCCLAVGLGEPSYERGATLQDADKAQSYLTKFKTAQEMTGASKVAKGSSRNQWQLLQDSMGGDAFAGSLFVEYAEAFKGQRQLTWSRGLKKYFNIEQVDDANCEVDDDAEQVISEDTVYFQDEQWHYIRRNKLQAHILNYAETHSLSELQSLIDKIPIVSQVVQDDPSLAVLRL